MKFTPEQKAAWRAEQRVKAKWRTLYGWHGVPAISGQDEDGTPSFHPFPAFFQKAWSAGPKEIVLSAPRRAEPRNAVIVRGRLRDALQATPVIAERNVIERSIRRLEKRIHESKPTRYIVWHDRTLRSVDNVLRNQFATLSPAERVAIAQQAQQKAA